jgi:hypothetical protein
MKKYAVFFAAIICLSLLCSCAGAPPDGGDGEGLPAEIEELNSNSNLPFPLALPSEEIGDASYYTYSPGFGGYWLHDDNIRITISGYPDVLDTRRTTSYIIRSDKYDLFGVKVGDSIERAASVLTAYGYTLVLEDYGYAHYENGDVRILPYGSSGIIEELRVSLSVTNKENIVF